MSSLIDSAPAATVEATTEIPDEKIRFDVVDVDDIWIDDQFQRPLNERWIADRDGKLDPLMLGAVILSERDGPNGEPYSGVDGQHRTELCRRNGRRKVAAIVCFDLTQEEEAALFARFQRERRNITPYQRFKAELTSGSEQAHAIQKIVREEGYELGEDDTPGVLKAVRAIERIYGDDPALLRTVLRLIRLTWNGMPYAHNERMIKAVWQFLRDTEDVSEERFVDRLSALTPTALVTRAHNLREARGMSGAIPRFLAEAIEDAYRSKRAVRS